MSNEGSLAEMPEGGPRWGQPDAAPGTRLLLVRHGETGFNAESRIQGQLDAPLSEKGRWQARCLAAAFTRERVDAIYASDLSRAFETAQIVGAAVGREAQPRAGFREVGFGEWQGLTTATIQQQYPELYQQWRAEPIRFRPPGGEAIEAVLERSVAETRAILKNHGGHTVLVVAHGGVIRAMVCGLLGLPIDVYPRLRVENTAVTRIYYTGMGAVLAGFNDTAHCRE